MRDRFRFLWSMMSDGTRILVLMSALMVTTPFWTPPNIWSIAAPLGATNLAIMTLVLWRIR